jgi:hypothetical protein
MKTMAAMGWLLALLLGKMASAQSLAGKWTGEYFDRVLRVAIAVELVQLPDSSYAALTYTTLPSYLSNSKEKTICAATARLVGKDSVQIEEVERLKGPAEPISMCLQKMWLKWWVRRKRMEMIGRWENLPNQPGCGGEGRIYLSKRKDE